LSIAWPPQIFLPIPNYSTAANETVADCHHVTWVNHF
jgi:hypothetical protein